MSHQLTFADEFSTKRRQTRKEIFLSRMERILPWQNMTAVISRFIPRRAMADGLSAGDHAAYSLHAALVQPERRCHGRCPCTKSPPCACLPDYLDSALPDHCHHHEFPPPARAASTGPSIVQDHQSLAGQKQAS